MRPRIRSSLALLASLVVCYGAAGIGGWLTSTSVGGWYVGIAKPPWTPPGWVIGLVWNVLFGLMAVAAFLVWRRSGSRGARGALALFAAQLALNVGWSALFFGLRSPGAALVELIALEAAILATLVAFRRHSAAAAWLLVPYAGWVAFAGALNASIWWLNR